jgi:hypothetical protein
MAGEPSDTEGDGMFNRQIDSLRDRMGLEQLAELSDDGCLCEEAD